MDLFFKNSKSNGIHYLNDFSLFFLEAMVESFL